MSLKKKKHLFNGSPFPAAGRLGCDNRRPIMPDNTHTIATGLQTGEPIPMLMSAFLSIAYYGVIELNLRIFFTFKRRRGLYFWSLLISTWGVAFNCTGYIFKFFQVIRLDLLSATLIVIGWTCMVTGQSVVLWSRLNLVLYDDAKLRGILVLIIVNAITCHVPVSVLVYGMNSTNPQLFTRPYEIYERVQLTIFASQEIFISCIYIYYTSKFLGDADTNSSNNNSHSTLSPRTIPRRTVMKQLIVVNLLMIAMDIVIVCLQYTGFYQVQTSFKAAAYSIKLKLEFEILNHLVTVSRLKRYNASSTQPSAMNGDADDAEDDDNSFRLPRRAVDRSPFGRTRSAPAFTAGMSTVSRQGAPRAGATNGPRRNGGAADLHSSNGDEYNDTATDVGSSDVEDASRASEQRVAAAAVALSVQFKDERF
jgi:hypothetical protein